MVRRKPTQCARSIQSDEGGPVHGLTEAALLPELRSSHFGYELVARPKPRLAGLKHDLPLIPTFHPIRGR